MSRICIQLPLFLPFAPPSAGSVPLARCALSPTVRALFPLAHVRAFAERLIRRRLRQVIDREVCRDLSHIVEGETTGARRMPLELLQRSFG